MNPLPIIRFGVLAAVVALIGLVGFIVLGGTKKGADDFGGPFVLQASSGGTIERARLTGKPYGVFFGYTNCPDFCPTTMQELTVLMQEIDKSGQSPIAKDFRVYFISIDPARDTPALLKLYLSAFDPRIIGLTGSEAETSAVIKGFHVYAKKNGAGDTYTFDHTSSILLFDAAGKLAGTINSTEREADQKAKLTRLLRG